MSKFQASDFELIAEGLEYPESPVYLPGGDILLVEIKGERLSRVSPDGKRSTIVDLPGGPNGCAFGPGGYVFVANNGGFDWETIVLGKQTLSIGMGLPKTYTGGKIERVNLDTGDVDTVYSDCGEGYVPLGTPPVRTKVPFDPPLPLRGPDDLVFDEKGNLWIPDFGKMDLVNRKADITGIFFAKADGSAIEQTLFPLASPNGIALSPDGTRVYTTLTYARQVNYWKLEEPGTSKIKLNPGTIDGAYCLTAKLPGQSILDSMAVDSDGNVYVATMLPEGNTPLANGGITIISPDGKTLENIEIAIPDHLSPLPSSLCFGGPDMKTLYVTCGAAGLLARVRVNVAGHPLHFNPYD